MREQFRGHPHFEKTEEFCRLFDEPAFDSNFKSMPLGRFEPMLQRVFRQPLPVDLRRLGGDIKVFDMIFASEGSAPCTRLSKNNPLLMHPDSPYAPATVRC